jgi:hypothetical protein
MFSNVLLGFVNCVNLGVCVPTPLHPRWCSFHVICADYKCDLSHGFKGQLPGSRAVIRLERSSKHTTNVDKAEIVRDFRELKFSSVCFVAD